MDGDLRNMVMSFRVTELQTLLAYAGKNRTGRKNELQARALDLVKSKSSPVVAKIKELYRSMQQSMSATGMATSGSQQQYQQPSGIVPHNQTRLTNYGSTYGSSSDVLKGIHQSYVSYSKSSQPMVTMPICPDVKMKRLPFYDIMNELIKPSSLLPQGIGRVQEASFPFCLTPQQAGLIGESKEFVAVSMGDQKLQYTLQVQLRFCSLDTSTSTEQDDQFPPNISVKVNNKVIPLPHPVPSNRPGVEAKRPSRPLNVTNYVRLSPTMTNTVTVTWASDNSSRGYAMSLYLVKKLTANDLLSRLKQKGPRPSEYSRGLIKELIAKDDGDCMIAMTSLKVSIACPLGKCRMSLPCRATTCKHLQCFDANLFLQMNERKPTFLCPVCDKPTPFEDLSIDGYFQEVISKLSGSEGMDVELLPDGSWKALDIVKKDKDKDECSPPTKKLKPDTKINQTINLEDDCVIDEDDVKVEQFSGAGCSTESTGSKKKKDGPAEIIDLTLDSSDDESDDAPVRPRRKATKQNYVIEDDSSSTTDASDDTAPTSPQVRPMSPACITLDSRSPSPEVRQARAEPPRPRSQTTPVAAGSNSSSSASASSLSGPSTSREGSLPAVAVSASSSNHRGTENRNNNSLPSNTFDYGHGHSYGHQPSGYPRSNSSSTATQPNLYGPGGASMPGYMPFDAQNIWGPGSSGNFQNPFATDFTQLDFQSLDYINSFDPRSNSNNNNPGYRWP